MRRFLLVSKGLSRTGTNVRSGIGWGWAHWRRIAATARRESSGGASSLYCSISGTRKKTRAVSSSPSPLGYRSGIDDDAYHDGRVEEDPADASKVNRLVALLETVNKPEACGEKIRGPGHE